MSYIDVDKATLTVFPHPTCWVQQVTQVIKCFVADAIRAGQIERHASLVITVRGTPNRVIMLVASKTTRYTDGSVHPVDERHLLTDALEQQGYLHNYTTTIAAAFTVAAYLTPFQVL